MLIEIVQHESNKVVKEATLEQALEYANSFAVNLVDSEGNRTPFVPADHVLVLGDEVAAVEAPSEAVVDPVAEPVADEASAEAAAPDTPAEA